jgi:hypothetical protein
MTLRSKSDLLLIYVLYYFCLMLRLGAMNGVFFDKFYLNIMSKEIESHVLEIYETVSFLGSGAYGHVWRVKHRIS